jgi:N-methylhydantoinase A
MQSSGGIIAARIAADEPVRTILSGPAGGVVAAMHVASQAGFPKSLAFDMGGTSTDVALIDSDTGLETTTESQIQGMPVAVPVLRIHTVGAGGGSLASFDGGGALKVGPESAGAVPGPACYGRGTQPTVTDANLLLGRLDPDAFLGGAMHLDIERTRAALITPHFKAETFAEGIISLANSHMAQALRKISVEQGHDPRDFTLVSFGGAGPLHACDLAQILRIPRVLVPNFPGALSAYGILLSDITRDHSQTVMLKAGDPAIVNRNPGWLDMRYKGQGYELRVPFTPDYITAFHNLHQKRYGYSDPRREIEVVNVRSRETIKTDKPVLPTFPLHPGQPAGKPAPIYADGKWHNGTIYNRENIQAGNTLSGPAVITEYSATTYLPPNTTARVDQFLNLIVELT